MKQWQQSKVKIHTEFNIWTHLYKPCQGQIYYFSMEISKTSSTNKSNSNEYPKCIHKDY